MKPLKIITLKDLKKIDQLQSNARFLKGDALAAYNQQHAEFYSSAWASVPVADLLATVHGKAAAHTYGFGAIMRLVKDAEKRLAESGVTVANRPGTRVLAESGVPESKSYARKSRSAIATQVVLTRTTVAWVLTSVEKTSRYTGPGGDERIATEISEAAKADIIKKALIGYRVAAVAATADTTVCAPKN